jgi:hypothetical protein
MTQRTQIGDCPSLICVLCVICGLSFSLICGHFFSSAVNALFSSE